MRDLTELPVLTPELSPGPGLLPQSSGLGVMQNGCMRVAKLHAIKSDIGQNLDRSDLSIAALAARHACTSRFVQRLFEMVGTTFTEYVLAQRLVRAIASSSIRVISRKKSARSPTTAASTTCRISTACSAVISPLHHPTSAAQGRKIFRQFDAGAMMNS